MQSIELLICFLRLLVLSDAQHLYHCAESFLPFDEEGCHKSQLQSRIRFPRYSSFSEVEFSDGDGRAEFDFSKPKYAAF